MPLDLQYIEQVIVERPGAPSLGLELLTELRAARSVLQRIVEEAKPVHWAGTFMTCTVPTSAIEAASKMLGRVRD